MYTNVQYCTKNRMQGFKLNKNEFKTTRIKPLTPMINEHLI